MSALKRLSFLVLVLSLMLTSFSCRADFFCGNNKPQKLNFKNLQKLQVITAENVYNLLVSFDEANGFYMEFCDEVPRALEDLCVKIRGDSCYVSCSGIEGEALLNELNNDFFPVVIYRFLSDLDVENIQFTFDENENAYFYKCNIFEKRVVFTVQPSLDEAVQNYILEIS